MVNQQNTAIWELCRQGLHRLAEEAEEHWNLGETFVLDASISVPLWVRHLVERCNRQAITHRH